MSDQFTCEQCGGTFDKEWSDAEAEAESRHLWGTIPENATAVICDDCFNAFLPNVPDWARQPEAQP